MEGCDFGAGQTEAAPCPHADDQERLTWGEAGHAGTNNSKLGDIVMFDLVEFLPL